MKKIILGLFVVVLLSGIVFALEEGQVLTQEQINAWEIEDYGLVALLIVFDCEQGNTNVTYINHYWWYFRSFTCLNIAPYENQTYIVYRNEYYPAFRIYDYIICQILHGEEECNERYARILRVQAVRDIFEIKDRVIGYKDNIDWWDVDDLGDLW